MITPTVKAVLFDLDGTLINSEYFYYSNWASMLANEFQLFITYEDWIKDFAGHTSVRNAQYLIDQFGIETTIDYIWKTTRENYAKSDMTTIELMPHVKETLDYLKEKNIRIALVTSSHKSIVDTVLGHHNLMDYFEFFITRELVENPKPNAEPYLLAIDKIGLPKEEIVAIEDTITGFMAATAAGLTCIAITKHDMEKERLVSASYLYEDLSILKNIIS